MENPLHKITINSKTNEAKRLNVWKYLFLFHKSHTFHKLSNFAAQNKYLFTMQLDGPV